MLSTLKSKRRAVLVTVVILLTACLALGVYSARKQQPTAHQQNRPTKEWLFSIPAVQSKVKGSETDAPGAGATCVGAVGTGALLVI